MSQIEVDGFEANGGESLRIVTSEGALKRETLNRNVVTSHTYSEIEVLRHF